MIITSSDNKKIKQLKKLKDRKYRDTEGLFLVEGDHLVSEAYNSELLLELILESSSELDFDVKTTYVTSNVMKELTSLATPTTVIGVCEKRKPSFNLGNHILILDNIQDPGNLGTIIRSAVAFNIDTIILGEGTVDIYNPKVLRATQGLIFKMNMIESKLLDIIPQLKKDNYIILGTNVIEGIELKSFSKPHKFALIMGNEGHGMNKDIYDLCDNLLYIKMNYACESLNVATACSIILYQLDE
ncbi:MAG: RNA methyltransferase [Bacilli bacterium]|nr:RNA methyltransferase [Bacilli bacterium]